MAEVKGQEEVPEGIRERLSKIKGILQELRRSIDITDKWIDDLRNDVSENRAEIRDLRSEIEELRGRLWWIIGILFSM